MSFSLRATLLLMVSTITAAILLAVPSASAADSPAVEYVTQEGIMIRDANNDFVAGGTVTRIDFTVAVIETLYPSEGRERCFENIAPRLPARYTHLFRDVKRDAPFAAELCTAIQAGLVSGKSDASFGPFEPITVAEASKILAHAQGLTYPSRFPSILPWYWSSMEALRIKGAINKTASPSALLSRGAMAQMFYALKDAERYPAARIIGYMPVTSAALTGDEDADGVTTGFDRRYEPGERKSRRLIREEVEAR